MKHPGGVGLVVYWARSISMLELCTRDTTIEEGVGWQTGGGALGNDRNHHLLQYTSVAITYYFRGNGLSWRVSLGKLQQACQYYALSLISCKAAKMCGHKLREIKHEWSRVPTFSSFLMASVRGLQSPSCHACLHPTQYWVRQLPHEVRRRFLWAGCFGWLFRNILWYHLHIQQTRPKQNGVWSIHS